jgi:hypothetical protein
MNLRSNSCGSLAAGDIRRGAAFQFANKAQLFRAAALPHLDDLYSSSQHEVGRVACTTFRLSEVKIALVVRQRARLVRVECVQPIVVRSLQKVLDVSKDGARDIESLCEVWRRRYMIPARPTRLYRPSSSKIGAAVFSELEVSQPVYVEIKMGRVRSISHSERPGVIKLRSAGCCTRWFVPAWAKLISESVIV